MNAAPRLFLSLLVLLLAACSSAPPALTVTRTNDVAYPPTRFVEVLDAPPSRPFTEIALINAPGEPGALRTQVMAQIRDRASAIGADAVIVQDLSFTAPAAQRLNPATGQYENTGGQMVPAFKAVAIKYK